jgi:hypothetical protein
MGYGTYVDREFFRSETMEAALKKGDDGELMLEISFKGEHGNSRPKSMTCKNWGRLVDNADEIGQCVNKAMESEAAIRKAEARKVELEGHLANLERAKVYMDGPAFNVSLQRIKAQYPEFYAVKETADA